MNNRLIVRKINLAPASILTPVKISTALCWAPNIPTPPQKFRTCPECDVLYGVSGWDIHPEADCEYGTVERVMEL